MKHVKFILIGLLGLLIAMLIVQPLIKSTRLNIYTEATIDVPVEKVWNALIATEDYGKWNPYHTSVVGKKEIGAPIRIDVIKPNGEEVIVEPKYMVIDSLRELTWGGGIKRIFYGKHVFRLKKLSESRTLLVQEETFSGLALPFVPLDAIEEGYVKCNKALKEYLENGLTISEKDKDKIRSLATDIPLILANQGWEAYEQLFDSEYRNWSMIGGNVRSRNEYLRLVKQWHEEGNRATESQVEDVEFIPIGHDLVMYLNLQREDFSDDNLGKSYREMSFVSIYKRIGDEWKLFFTAFMDKPLKK